MVELLAWYRPPSCLVGGWVAALTNRSLDPEEESYAQVQINLNHPIKLSRIAMRQLVSENRRGVILPFGSVNGIAGSYNCPLYTATKHGEKVNVLVQ